MTRQPPTRGLSPARNIPHLTPHLIRAAADWLDAHAAVLFSQSRLAAVLCLAATAIHPRVLLIGLAAWLLTEAIFTILDLPALARPAARTNALLTGLALASLWAPSGDGSSAWWLIFPLAVVLVISLSLWLGEALWRAGALPALSLPFSLGLMLILPVLGGMTPAIPALPIPPGLAQDTLTGALLAAFGWLFLSPHPLSGALILLALLIASRWLALLGLAGYAIGQAVMVQLAPDSVGPGYAFNFPLAAMAVGGYYCRPGLGSFILGMLAAALAALGCAVFAETLGRDGIPALSLPFVAVTLLLLAGLRHARRGITTVLTHADTPERQAEAQRLARSRLGPPDSLPLAPPFLGEWQVYQGFDGPHTHRGPWRHALDFFITEDGVSYRGAGRELTDYRCFGLPVLAPVAGEVVAVRDGLPDNPPGFTETTENWGNHLVLRTAGGLHVWLAHLRQGSIEVQLGAVVRVGDRLAACGNSGRSPQPHLHLHVQTGPTPGEATLPFHLDNVDLGQPRPCWRLASTPDQGESVRAARMDPALIHALALPVGRRLGFEVSDADGVWRPWQVEVTLTLLGQLRLTGERASVAVAPGPHAFALYDRQGGEDPWLDLFILALGLTPLSAAEFWRDAPPARLFPASPVLRAALWLTRPLGAALDSHYHRAWWPESASWRQSARHVLRAAPAWQAVFTTEAEFTPDGRLVRIEGRRAGAASPDGHRRQPRRQMRLAALSQLPDEGIPAWNLPVTPLAT